MVDLIKEQLQTLIVQCHRIEVAMESALESARKMRADVEGFINSGAAPSPVLITHAEPINHAEPVQHKALSEESATEVLKQRKRRSRCKSCSELHWPNECKGGAHASR